MTGWHLLLYAAASFLALRSLISLMTHHKRRFKTQLLRKEQREQERQTGVAAAPQNGPPASDGKSRKTQNAMA